MLKKSIGIKFPLQDSNNVFIDVNQISKDETISNLIHFILTQDGEKYERLYQPNFGTNLKKYLFEPITPELVNDITVEIKNKVNQFFPSVNITNIGFDVNESQQLVNINIKYSITEGVFNNNGETNISLLI